jgi:hypothetical protein
MVLMADEQPGRPRALDDLLGQQVRYRGEEWTVRYSEVARRVVLEKPVELEGVLAALRHGVLVLQTDPQDYANQALPTTRDAAVQEWLTLDAMITGAGIHGRFTTAGIAALERRLAVMTALLADMSPEATE